MSIKTKHMLTVFTSTDLDGGAYSRDYIQQYSSLINTGY